MLRDKIACDGTSRVVPTATGCERIIEGTIQVAVPLVGGAVERQIVGEISRSYERAADVLRRHLERKA